MRPTRVIWMVLDGVGAGAAVDAAAFGDTGANTLGNLASAFAAVTGRPLAIPRLARLGLGNVTSMTGVPACARNGGRGACGRARERSRGKDTTVGHWEMAGVVVEEAFATFPDGFPSEHVARWVRENDLPGVLGNRPASGTAILDELGAEHLRSGKPILYTSADSVWQVAAHEEAFGLERLDRICRSARRLCDELRVARVIARPFVGDPARGEPFRRTYHRKDHSQPPPSPTYLDVLADAGVPTVGVGKIASIYAGRGIAESVESAGNADGLRIVTERVARGGAGLLFCNLVDFDMLYGHRRDVRGFGEALEELDVALGPILDAMTSEDLLLITADHGNDPTFRGTDHTREDVPILIYTPAADAPGPIELGTRDTFADVGATVVHALLGAPPSLRDLAGVSFLDDVLSRTAPRAVAANR